MTIAVPSLSSAGWVRSPNEKADALLSHFFLSEKSQTYLYADNVSSLPWLVEQYGRNPIAISTELGNALERYLGRYYDTVNADVTVDDAKVAYNGEIAITLYCSVTEEGRSYSFGKLLMVTNSKIQQIINLNNAPQ